MNKNKESCRGYSKGLVFVDYCFICNTAIPFTPQSEMNVVSSGAVVGCQTRFDPVRCGRRGSLWGQEPIPLTKSHLTVWEPSTSLSSLERTIPRQLLLKFQRCSGLAREGSSLALFPTPVLCVGVLWLAFVLVPEVPLYLG